MAAIPAGATRRNPNVVRTGPGKPTNTAGGAAISRPGTSSTDPPGPGTRASISCRRSLREKYSLLSGEAYEAAARGLGVAR